MKLDREKFLAAAIALTAVAGCSKSSGDSASASPMKDDPAATRPANAPMPAKEGQVPVTPAREGGVTPPAKEAVPPPAAEAKPVAPMKGVKQPQQR
jgi:hypothetical protein